MVTEIVFLYGWGPEEEGRLSSLLHLVRTTSAMEMTASVFFFSDGAVLSRKGSSAKMSGEIGKRLSGLLADRKVSFYVCEEAARKRSIAPQDLEAGIRIIGYATFLDRIVSADKVITI